ncbi:hypothetical protein DSECCO2_381300 [anaerobic digester metagenome]
MEESVLTRTLPATGFSCIGPSAFARMRTTSSSSSIKSALANSAGWRIDQVRFVTVPVGTEPVDQLISGPLEPISISATTPAHKARSETAIRTGPRNGTRPAQTRGLRQEKRSVLPCRAGSSRAGPADRTDPPSTSPPFPVHDTGYASSALSSAAAALFRPRSCIVIQAKASAHAGLSQ